MIMLISKLLRIEPNVELLFINVAGMIILTQDQSFYQIFENFEWIEKLKFFQRPEYQYLENTMRTIIIILLLIQLLFTHITLACNMIAFYPILNNDLPNLIVPYMVICLIREVFYHTTTLILEMIISTLNDVPVQICFPLLLRSTARVLLAIYCLGSYYSFFRYVQAVNIELKFVGSPVVLPNSDYEFISPSERLLIMRRYARSLQTHRPYPLAMTPTLAMELYTPEESVIDYYENEQTLISNIYANERNQAVSTDNIDVDVERSVHSIDGIIYPVHNDVPDLVDHPAHRRASMTNVTSSHRIDLDLLNSDTYVPIVDNKKTTQVNRIDIDDLTNIIPNDNNRSAVQESKEPKKIEQTELLAPVPSNRSIVTSGTFRIQPLNIVQASQLDVAKETENPDNINPSKESVDEKMLKSTNLDVYNNIETDSNKSVTRMTVTVSNRSNMNNLKKDSIGTYTTMSSHENSSEQSQKLEISIVTSPTIIKAQQCKKFIPIGTVVIKISDSNEKKPSNETTTMQDN